MAKVMTSTKFVETAKKIESTLKTKYQLGGWGQQSNGYYLFDCVCLLKSILWGFNFETGGHGGAVYKANGVADVNADTMMTSKYCTDLSTDFSKIQVGEFVGMKGHIGVYIGNGKVIEATSGWEKKVLISEIDSKGRRTRNGKQIYSWTKHGKSIYLDYGDDKMKFKIGDKVVISGKLYPNANADKHSGVVENKVTNITRIAAGSKHPYNTTGDLGWMNESDIKLYQETETNYKELYEKQLLINKDLQTQLDIANNKIKKAIADLQG